MYFRIAVKVGFLMLMVVSLCHAQSDPFYYYMGIPMPITIDKTKYFIKFSGINPD